MQYVYAALGKTVLTAFPRRFHSLAGWVDCTAPAAAPPCAWGSCTTDSGSRWGTAGGRAAGGESQHEETLPFPVETGGHSVDAGAAQCSRLLVRLVVFRSNTNNLFYYRSQAGKLSFVHYKTFECDTKVSYHQTHLQSGFWLKGNSCFLPFLEYWPSFGLWDFEAVIEEAEDILVKYNFYSER